MEKMNLKSEISSGANQVYVAVVWFFLLGNLIGAIVYGALYILTLYSNDSNALSLNLLIPLCFVNVFALYLLLKPDPFGFKILIVTSVLSCLISWYNGLMVAGVFKVFGTTEFYMFALSATFFPFASVVLIYIVGKNQMVRRSSATHDPLSDARNRTNKKSILIVTLVTLGVLLLPFILFFLLLLALDFAPGGFHI